jgi:hypothetical protein
MNYTKKYLFVTYVQNLEKPMESYLENLNKNMSDIIQDKKVPADEKIKLYNKNLTNFLLKYDADSYGVAPTLTKLADVVSKFIQNNNSHFSQDNSNVFEKNINSTPAPDSNFTTNTVSSNQIRDKNPIDVNYNITPHFNNSRSISEGFKTPEQNSRFQEIDKSNEQDLSTDGTVYNEISISDPNIDLFGFSKGTKPTDNLRSKGPATHYKGLENKTRTLNLPSKVTLPSPINQNSNFLNLDTPSKSNKFKNTSKTSNSSNGKQQIARGILWKTKKNF